MFNKILGWIRSVINKMLNINIGTKFKVDVAISNEMITAKNAWENLYKDEARWLNEDVISCGLPAAIAREFATSALVEFESDITGSERADFLNETYKKMKKKLRKNLEYGCALGDMVFKPYVANNKLIIDVVKGTNFFPVEYDSNEDCTAGIFVSRKIEGKYYFTRLEYHKLDVNKKQYKIVNKAYMSTTEEILGQEISLKTVSDWTDIESEVTIENVEKVLFGYFRVPLANTIDIDSPNGVSVYSRAIRLIEEADKQFSRLLWEFEGSELAIDADPTALQSSKIMTDKLELPKLKERLFRAGGGTSRDGKNFYEVFSPAIRETDLYKGFNDILKRIEFVCGLAYGTISDPEMIEKTATEINSAKQRSYATIKDIQRALEDALEDTIYAMDILTTLYKLAPIGNFEINYTWDDSILVDAKEEQTIMMQEANMGYIKKEIYLMKRYGVTEEQAREMMPVQESEQQDNEEDEE